MFDCHVSNFKLRPSGDSAHVKLTVTFQTMDLLYNNFTLYASFNDMHVTYIIANSCITDNLILGDGRNQSVFKMVILYTDIANHPEDFMVLNHCEVSNIERHTVLTLPMSSPWFWEH